jgi:quinol-cytochrome oxidoreductase complex cytochrome b subunit
VRSGRFRPIFKWFFLLLLVDAVALGMAGAHRPEGTWKAVGQIATLYYFIHFLIILPLLGKLEKPRPLPASISATVLKGGATLAGARAAMEKP